MFQERQKILKAQSLKRSSLLYFLDNQIRSFIISLGFKEQPVFMLISIFYISAQKHSNYKVSKKYNSHPD